MRAATGKVPSRASAEGNSSTSAISTTSLIPHLVFDGRPSAVPLGVLGDPRAAGGHGAAGESSATTWMIRSDQGAKRSLFSA